MVKLTVTQKPENGILGGPKATSFSVRHKNVSYNVNIDQFYERRITIQSSDSCAYMDDLDVYYSLETLLMLFDGCFYPVISAYDNDIEITQSWKKRALPSYHSADFMIGTGNRLVDFETVLDAAIFTKWCALKEELDLIHKMVLYCWSSVQMPKDMQCAFMTEAFEGLAELVSQRKTEIVFPRKTKTGESQLQLDLITFISYFGTEIFKKETESDVNRISQILVDSRNRIAHIKSKQDRVYLGGSESVMYLLKQSLLYRVVLFDLLGIDSGVYKTRLIARVQAIDNHDVMRAFLKSLCKREPIHQGGEA